MANRVNNHNSRKGTNGKAIGVKHNDRDFDTNSEYATHIDSNKEQDNVYLLYQDVSKECLTLEEFEQAFYEENFSECLQARNEKAIKGRQPKRVQTMEQYRHNLKACPEESIFTLSNAKNPIDADTLQSVFDEFIEWHIKQFQNIKVLDSALHLDEANPHIHWRRVWTAHEDGMLIIGQEKALKEMGIERPDTEKRTSRTNNAKVTYTRICREKQIELARKHGIEVEEIAQEPSKNGKELLEYQINCLIEEKEEKDEHIKQLQATIEDMQERESRLQQQALAYEFEPKGKFERESHYNARKELHEVQVGLKHAGAEQARREQNFASENEAFEEYKRREKQKLSDEAARLTLIEKTLDEEIEHRATEIAGEIAKKEIKEAKEEIRSLRLSNGFSDDRIKNLEKELSEERNERYEYITSKPTSESVLNRNIDSKWHLYKDKLRGDYVIFSDYRDLLGSIEARLDDVEDFQSYDNIDPPQIYRSRGR